MTSSLKISLCHMVSASEIVKTRFDNVCNTPMIHVRSYVRVGCRVGRNHDALYRQGKPGVAWIIVLSFLSSSVVASLKHHTGETMYLSGDKITRMMNAGHW